MPESTDAYTKVFKLLAELMSAAVCWIVLPAGTVKLAGGGKQSAAEVSFSGALLTAPDAEAVPAAPPA